MNAKRADADFAMYRDDFSFFLSSLSFFLLFLSSLSFFLLFLSFFSYSGGDM